MNFKKGKGLLVDMKQLVHIYGDVHKKHVSLKRIKKVLLESMENLKNFKQMRHHIVLVITENVLKMRLVAIECNI